MLLLNLVRVLITLVGLIIFDALRVAYDLTNFGLLSVLAGVLLVVFVACDLAEDGLIDYFNQDEKEPTP